VNEGCLPFRCLLASNQVGLLVENVVLPKMQHSVSLNMSVCVPLDLDDAAGTIENNQQTVQKKKGMKHFE